MVLAKLIRGLLDGALATLGIVIGASAASGVIIIAAAVGGALANGISNAVSAYSAESAIRYGELRETEKAMVSGELRGAQLDRRLSQGIVASGAADGLATVIGGAVPILPYIFLPPGQAMFVAIGLVVAVTGVIGVYLGRVSRRSIVFSAIKMAGLGIVVAVVAYVVQAVIVPGE